MFMNSKNHTNFIKREVDLDPSRVFEACVTKIADSVIAFAYGTHKNGSPNVIGTGFNVANLDKKAGLFVTCFHVIQEITRIKGLSLDALDDEDIIDKKRRIAFLNNGKYEWNEVEYIRFSDKFEVNGENLVKQNDACICYIPGIFLPPLSLSPDEYFMGSEMGVVGFPNFEHLQQLSVQPYVLKTILSSHMWYPFEIDGKVIKSERIALDCMAGEGFSGSPVFSSRTGDIVGMVDYLPTETYLEDLKMVKPTISEADIRVHYAAGLSFAVPSKLIQRLVKYAVKVDWEGLNGQDQKITLNA